MVQSLSRAFHIFDTQKEGIPYEAIRYVRHQPFSREIDDKIIFALSHAYDGTYYDASEDYYYSTPLWYAVVAEIHLSERLTDPVIRLHTTTNDDWDFLSGQGEYLIGKLAEKFPDITVPKIMSAIDQMIVEKSKKPYLYLFEALCFGNKEKIKGWFLKTLSCKDLNWGEMFAHIAVDMRMTEAIPVLKDLIRKKQHWSKKLFRKNRNEIQEYSRS